MGNRRSGSRRRIGGGSGMPGYAVSTTNQDGVYGSIDVDDAEARSCSSWLAVALLGHLLLSGDVVDWPSPEAMAAAFDLFMSKTEEDQEMVSRKERFIALKRGKKHNK